MILLQGGRPNTWPQLDSGRDTSATMGITPITRRYGTARGLAPVSISVCHSSRVGRGVPNLTIPKGTLQ